MTIRTDVMAQPREDVAFSSNSTISEKIEKNSEKSYKMKLSWGNIIVIGGLHIAAVHGAYLLASAKTATILFGFLLYILTGGGITAGAHRLWAHRSYKAKLPLRLFLVFVNTMAWQYSIIHWARDHRIHHKCSDTNADPYNIKRGFFFSHMGWLFCEKHPDVKEKGKGLDMSDLWSDPILRFQKKYYNVLVPLICIFIPTIIPVYCWNESWKHGFFICFVLRYILLLNASFLVNSAAHRYGNKPYDRNMGPTENGLVSFVTAGEGWHNYHHTFPWDYRASEFGYSFSLTNMLIESCARIGLAYDLKSVSTEDIKRRAQRTGDGSHNKNY